MIFNSKNIILVGIILFIFQLINFFSVESINPSFERAQVLSALSAIIIILIGLLFERFNPISGDKVELVGEINFIYDSDIPKVLLKELAWGTEAILTSTAAASILIHNKHKNILRRGLISDKEFRPGEICFRAMKENKLISLVNTKFYPGKEEFNNFCNNVPAILIVPINNDSFLLIGGWSTRCFTKSDEKWILNWAKKLSSIFIENDI